MCVNLNQLVTIIIPIYNVELYISRCIESVLCQTYENIEIILVDDGSPDNCGRICDEYALKDSRIRVIHKENGGLSDARNVALDIATGKYVTFIDSDDFVSVDYVKILYGLINKYNASMSISGFLHYYEGKGMEKLCDTSTIENYIHAFEAVETMFYQDKFETTAWGKLYKKDLFGDDIRYPKGLLYEDLPITYKLIIRAEKVAYTTQKTYFYVIRNNSIQRSAFNLHKMDILKVADMMLSDIQNNNPDLLPSLKCRLFSICSNIFMQTDKSCKYEMILWQRIVEYRKNVLINFKGRKKARLAAIISFLGKNVMRNCFKLIKDK
jgi:glycosyltransferase involved in cell wall biosynthesis